MAKSFKDSVVLTQNSSGVSLKRLRRPEGYIFDTQHCSISATSLCTAKVIRSYFINGTLPEIDAVCQVESSIFEDELALGIEANDEDGLLLAASRILQEKYPISLARFGRL